MHLKILKYADVPYKYWLSPHPTPTLKVEIVDTKDYSIVERECQPVDYNELDDKLKKLIDYYKGR